MNFLGLLESFEGQYLLISFIKILRVHVVHFLQIKVLIEHWIFYNSIGRNDAGMIRTILFSKFFNLRIVLSFYLVLLLNFVPPSLDIVKENFQCEVAPAFGCSVARGLIVFNFDSSLWVS